MFEHIYIKDVDDVSKFYFNKDSLTNNSLWYISLTIFIWNLKNRFMNDLSIRLGRGSLYEFIEP